MKTSELVELRKEAEKAVAEMTDGDLKLKAFEVILGHLLSASGEMTETPAKAGVQAKGKAALQPAKAKSAAARVLVLRNEGFFRSQRSMGEVSDELAAHGWHYPLTSLSGTLISLAQRQELRRVRAKKGNKRVWLYSEA